MKRAFITGFTGQDGTFLTRHLLDKGYEVIGLVRRISTEPPRRVRGRFDFTDEIGSGQLVLEEGDLLSPRSLNRIIGWHQPHEIYNLAAQSHVGLSFSQPEYTIDSILNGTINLITALETAHRGSWRMYQASTSEMFGDRKTGTRLDETSRFEPTSPYAIAKTAAHFYCRMKRKEGMFIASGILFNHESEIRGGDFVTQKIVRGVAHWLHTGEALRLGNLNAVRDWGYAGDYVDAMWRMLQHDTPLDLVIATGATHTVRDFVNAAFKAVGFSLEWAGEGADELATTGRWSAVMVDPRLYRPAEVGYLRGDAELAKKLLGWQPKVTFEELVALMVKAVK